LCGQKPGRPHHEDPRARRCERPSGLPPDLAGAVHDAACAEVLLNGLQNGAVVIADEGYDADSIRAHIRGQGAVPNIPNRSNCKTKYRWTKALYRERNRVERFFNRLKQFRRIATRYDKLGANFFAFIKLASMRIWLRSIESTL
jgi:transposase